MISEIQVFILVLVAVAAGWFMGQRGNKPRVRDERSDFESDYFRGLNYLLNEQPDKAIEVFCQMMEVNAETLETHFALGSLFRRRGEVDRAIRIHQNLIARPDLGRRERTLAMLELGKDYLKAGLLDRAESLFEELVSMGAHQDAAYNHLMDIYEQEKDWIKAIESAEKLGRACPQTSIDRIHHRIAHYHCELATQAESPEQAEHLGEALKVDPTSTRGHLGSGNLSFSAGDWGVARDHYLAVLKHDPSLFPLVRDRLTQCFQKLDDHEQRMRILNDLLVRAPSVEAIIARIELAREFEGPDAAEQLAVELCTQHPTVDGLNTYLELIRDKQSHGDELRLLSDVLTDIAGKQPGFRCAQCGFSSRAMHWQCPSCKTWGELKPVSGESLT